MVVLSNINSVGKPHARDVVRGPASHWESSTVPPVLRTQPLLIKSRRPFTSSCFFHTHGRTLAPARSECLVQVGTFSLPVKTPPRVIRLAYLVEYIKEKLLDTVRGNEGRLHNNVCTQSHISGHPSLPLPCPLTMVDEPDRLAG